MKHNSHVLKYKRFLLFLAEYYHRPMAQLVHYTELMLEENTDWSPYAEA